MIGLFVILAGWVCLVVAAVVLWGVAALLVAGVVMLAVGVFVDLDRVKEPQRAKRDQSSP
jgi:membrane-bound ClpP family serine protease